MKLLSLYNQVLNESIKDKIILKSKSDKGNRYFEMLKTAKYQHYDSPKGELSTFNKGEEDRKRLVSKLSQEDKKKYREWLKTPEGKESLKLFKRYETKFDSKVLKEGKMVDRPLFKKGDKVKYKSSDINLDGYTTKIFTVMQDETRDSYGVYINVFNDIEPENNVLYKEFEKIKEGSTIFNDKLPENKLEIEDSHSKKKHIINKSDLIAYFIKDYVLELA